MADHECEERQAEQHQDKADGTTYEEWQHTIAYRVLRIAYCVLNRSYATAIRNTLYVLLQLHFGPVEHHQPIRRGDDSLDARAQQNIELRVIQGQPADFVDRDLLGLIVELEPSLDLRAIAQPVGLLDQRVELLVGEMAVVVSSAGVQLLREEVLRVGVVGAPDAQIELESVSRRVEGGIQAFAEGRQLERLQLDLDAEV